MFLYSPDATREMTSRLVIHDGFAAAASVINHHDEILHQGDGLPRRETRLFR
jgi:hypothetical protein